MYWIPRFSLLRNGVAARHDRVRRNTLRTTAFEQLDARCLMAGDISAISEFAVAMDEKPSTAIFGSLVAGVQITLSEAPVIDKSVQDAAGGGGGTGIQTLLSEASAADKGVQDATGGGGGTGTVASISPTPRSPGALSPISSRGPGGGPR
jgi:hypothetical protein